MVCAWTNGDQTYWRNRTWPAANKLTLKMMNCFKDYKKMYSHFVSYFGFCSTEEDKILKEATLHAAYSVDTMPTDALVT